MPVARRDDELPYVGAVIRYGYLWRDEALRQRDAGRKDRPCLIVAAATLDEAVRVYVMPITRTAHTPDRSIELSRPVRRRLGLDTARPGWLVIDEINHFVWRGTDVVPVGPGREHYGRLDDSLTEQAKRRLIDTLRAGRTSPTSRDRR